MCNKNALTLTNIPTELVEHIATFLEVKDLCNLRLVCRILVTSIDRTYAAKVFHCLPIFINSEDSLDRALAIVRHAVFGKAICKVSLYIEEFDNWHSSKENSRIVDFEEKGLKDSDTEDEMSSEKGRKEDILSENASKVEKTRDTRLTAILGRLQEFKNLQEVQLATLSEAESCPIIPAAVDKAQLMVPHPSNMSCINRVLRAMQNAHLLVPKLSIKPKNWALSSRKAGRSPLSGLFKSALQDVEHLQLHCWLGGSSSDLDHAPRFMADLASAPKLKSLTFRNARQSSRSRPMLAILKQYFPKLETLRLESGGCGTSVVYLRNFIARHETLKRVELENVAWAMIRFDKELRPGETKEDLARRYFQLPGTYKVSNLGSIGLWLDFTWVNDGEKNL